MIRSTMADSSQGAEEVRAAELLRIVDLIRARTYDRVQNLAVTFAADSGGVLLSGQVHTFYVKQLAQHAALEAMRGETAARSESAMRHEILYNEIEVRHAAEASPPPAHMTQATAQNGR